MRNYLIFLIVSLLTCNIATAQIVAIGAAPEPVNVKKQQRMKKNSYRFPRDKEWQNMFSFNFGEIGRYPTFSDLSHGSQHSSFAAFSWDIDYIGGGLFRKGFFIGFGTGMSGYRNENIHKLDLNVPIYLHMKWYMLGNSTLSPFIATSQGVDLYISQDYGRTRFEPGLHSRFDIGLHIRPAKYSKFGMSFAFEFGFSPYRVAQVSTMPYTFYDIHYSSGYNGSFTIIIQDVKLYKFNFASYMGGAFAIAF